MGDNDLVLEPTAQHGDRVAREPTVVSVHGADWMKATLIGTGTAFSRRYGNTNILVEAGQTRLMIDFGYTTTARLESRGEDLRSISHIAISHIHADHVGGLEEIAFLSRFVFGIRPSLLLPRALAEDLWEHSLRGGMEMISDDHGNALRCTLESYFDPIILDQEWRLIGDLEIKAFANDHVPGKASFGFVVRDIEHRHSMIFGCDVRRRISHLDADSIDPEFATGPIFHDCQFYDDGPSGVHIPFHELQKYPASVRERIVLVHYNESVSEHLGMIREAGFKIGWPGNEITMPDWRASLSDEHEADDDQ